MKGLVALLVAAAIWAAGLMAFAERVQRSTPAAAPPAADETLDALKKQMAEMQAQIEKLAKR